MLTKRALRRMLVGKVEREIRAQEKVYESQPNCAGLYGRSICQLDLGHTHAQGSRAHICEPVVRHDTGRCGVVLARFWCPVGDALGQFNFESFDEKCGKSKRK